MVSRLSGLNRLGWFTASSTPWRSQAASIASASAMLVASAFSTMIAFTPASAAAMASSAFSGDWVQTETMSGRSSRSSCRASV